VTRIRKNDEIIVFDLFRKKKVKREKNDLRLHLTNDLELNMQIKIISFDLLVVN